MEHSTPASNRAKCGRPSTVNLEEHRSTIEMLWTSRKWKLKDIMHFMKAEHGLEASEKVFKYRLAAWGLSKNITNSEMQQIAKLKLRREKVGKRTKFRIRGRPVEMRKVQRWIAKQQSSLGYLGFKSWADSDIVDIAGIEYETEDEDEETIAAPTSSLDHAQVIPTTEPHVVCVCPRFFRVINCLPNGKSDQRDIMGNQMIPPNTTGFHFCDRQCNPPPIFYANSSQGQISLKLLSKPLIKELYQLLPTLPMAIDESIDATLLHENRHIFQLRLEILSSDHGQDPDEFYLINELELFLGFLENEGLFGKVAAEPVNEIQSESTPLGEFKRIMSDLQQIEDIIVPEGGVPSEDQDSELQKNIETLNGAFVRADTLATEPSRLHRDPSQAMLDNVTQGYSGSPPYCQRIWRRESPQERAHLSISESMIPIERDCESNIPVELDCESSIPIERDCESSIPRWRASSNSPQSQLYNSLVEAARCGDLLRVHRKQEAKSCTVRPSDPRPNSFEEDIPDGDAKTVEDLRHNFILQYIKMRKAARKSVTKFRVCIGDFKNYRDVWDDGIKVLRDLCHLNLPPSLNHTLSFLCIARAIAETLQDEKNDYLDQFAYDLQNWGETFSTNADRMAYLEALKLIWNVSLDCFQWHHQSPNQQQLFLNLRDHAAKLVLQANGTLGIDDLDTRAPEHNCIGSMVAPHIAQINYKASYDTNFSPVITALLTGVIFALVICFSEVFVRCIQARDMLTSIKTMGNDWEANDSLNPTLLSRPSTPVNLVLCSW